MILTSKSFQKPLTLTNHEEITFSDSFFLHKSPLSMKTFFSSFSRHTYTLNFPLATLNEHFILSNAHKHIESVFFLRDVRHLQTPFWPGRFSNSPNFATLLELLMSGQSFYTIAQWLCRWLTSNYDTSGDSELRLLLMKRCTCRESIEMREKLIKQCWLGQKLACL